MKKPTFINSINEDYSDYCLAKLQEVDPSYSESDTGKRVHDYHRYKFRKIIPRPRQVLIPTNFNCPSEFQSPYNDILTTIKNGDSLFPRQSRMLKSTDYDDDMLMDWGVQHLHLGTTIGQDGFVERTSELLFVRFTQDAAYVIGIFKHQEWTNFDVIETLHTNWPDSVERFKLNGIIETASSRNENELKQLRKVHVNSFITVSDGTTYTGPGLGMTSAGTPTKVQFDIMKLFRIFENAFKQIETNYESIFNQLEIAEDHDKITVGLLLQDDKLIYELKELQKGIY